MLINKQLINNVVNNTECFSGRIFSYTIQSLIVITLMAFSVSTLPDLSTSVLYALRLIEVFTVLFFTVEYLLRIYVSERKLKFIFSFYGLIDLAAILPFYIASGLDLRSVRIIQLLRLVRILKLIRYSQAMNRYHRALVIVREELILFCFVALIMLYLSAVGIYFFENEAQPEQFKSVFHSLWWSITTLTTVGYGDMYPVTLGGKIFTFLVLMIGLGIVAVPAGLLASALSQARAEEKADKTSKRHR